MPLMKRIKPNFGGICEAFESRKCESLKTHGGEDLLVFVVVVSDFSTSGRSYLDQAERIESGRSVDADRFETPGGSAGSGRVGPEIR